MFDFLLLNVIRSVLTCLCEVVLNLLDPQCWDAALHHRHTLHRRPRTCPQALRTLQDPLPILQQGM